MLRPAFTNSVSVVVVVSLCLVSVEPATVTSSFFSVALVAPTVWVLSLSVMVVVFSTAVIVVLRVSIDALLALASLPSKRKSPSVLIAKVSPAVIVEVA
jgi:hypothetical protein